MNTTNKETAQWVIDNRYSKGEGQRVSDTEIYITILEALNAKDNKHREETREIVEGMPLPLCSCKTYGKCTICLQREVIEAYKQIIKDKYNLN